ncbi:MAG: NAD(P)/FAD-dependent oxidoreductase [Candidatus Cloacimonetes bacterium]|nr:NAD(P)/FAD-dependent oxidoreductase [Candidatus Cloacimonadota bacterium]
MTNENQFDVVVVGAGPAGSVSARFAAENGLSVLMLERDREPGIPVRCAEGISGGGLETFINIDKRWIASEITAARLYTPDGNMLEMKSEVKGYVLERRIFDSALCDIACNKGVIMKTKSNVTGMQRNNDHTVTLFYKFLGEERQVKCRIVIGADGIESRVGRWFGLKTNLKLEDISTSVQYTINNIKVDRHVISFFFGTKIAPGGYVWIFPKSETSANVGVGIAGSFASHKRAQEYLDEFVCAKFPNASVSYIVYAGIPIATTLPNIIADNLMLVGDAAHQVNPITGGGIKQAMIAGKIAGETAAEAIRKDDCSAKALKPYSQKWEKALGSKHRFMYSIKEKVLYASDERLNKISEMCKNMPPDQFTLTDLFKQVIKGDPKLIADMAKAFVVSKINF